MIFTEIGENQNLQEAEATFFDAVKSGKDIGLLSEAGCPGVADPGAAIVSLAHREGIKVVPLVGPSSPVAGPDGFRHEWPTLYFSWLFAAQTPRTRKDHSLKNLTRQNNQTQMFIETPYRAQIVVEVALETLQADTVFGMAQDITGNAELIRSLPVKAWKSLKMNPLELPAIFLISEKAAMSDMQGRYTFMCNIIKSKLV